jgi:hypothetical protein
MIDSSLPSRRGCPLTNEGAFVRLVQTELDAIRVCEHAPSANPRNEGWCVKCGHTMEARDRDYEEAFLENVCREASRRFGMDCAGYKLAVKRRLELGAERYGDMDFMTKDNMRELLEETPDLAGYALLEAQKTLRLNLDDDEQRAWHLFEASVYGAAADHHARLALRRV